MAGNKKRHLLGQGYGIPSAWGHDRTTTNSLLPNTLLTDKQKPKGFKMKCSFGCGLNMVKQDGMWYEAITGFVHSRKRCIEMGGKKT